MPAQTQTTSGPVIVDAEYYPGGIIHTCVVAKSETVDAEYYPGGIIHTCVVA
jgi:hypothetical protein